MALDWVEYIAYCRLPGLIDARRLLAGGGAKPPGEFTTTGSGAGGEEKGNDGSLWLKGSVCVCVCCPTACWELSHGVQPLASAVPKTNVTTDELRP